MTVRVTTAVRHIEHCDDGTLRISTDGVEIRVLMMTEDIVRIRAGFDGDFREESYALTMTAWEDRLDTVLGEDRQRIRPAPTTLHDEAERAVLESERLRIEIDKQPFVIRVRDRDGTVLHEDVPHIGYREDPNRRRWHTSRIEEGDAFFGFGETTGPLDKHHERITLSPRDSLGYDAERSDPLYKHIPFYVKVNRDSGAATGYFYHNTHDMTFDMGRSHSNYFPHHSRLAVDGGDIDLFVIAGPQVREVVARYTLLTGRPPVLPRQALGYLASSMYYAELDADCDQAIVRFVDIARQEGFPVDGFQLSSGYSTQTTSQGPKRCVFTWNQERFPDPEAFFSTMSEKDVVVSPNVKPGVLEVHPRFQEFGDADVFVGASEDGPQGQPTRGAWWGGPGTFVDFTSPRAREAWSRWLTDDVLDKGTASVWNDNCEYDGVLDLDARCDLDGRGGTIAEVRTVMANLMCAVTRDAIQQRWPEQRPFIVCRAGHAGIQRFAQTWAGDNATSWQSLRANIATILGMSLSGVANQGCDIGGFDGPRPEPELFLRWVQHGIFQPRFSIHSVNSDNTVTEPWMYPAMTPLIRDAVLLRYRLMPYLYSLMVRASRDGTMIMEPLVSAFQDDLEGYETTDVFMLGDALLVAGVLEKGARTRTVRFPAGETFYDLGTRERHEGGTTVEVPVDLASIPLFLRGGQILPIAVEQPMNLARDEVRTLRVVCAPDRDGSFVLHEDDGLTRAHEQGDRCETRIDMAAGSTVTIDISRSGPYRSALRHLLMDVIHPQGAPLRILADGSPLPHHLHRGTFEEESRGWHYDAELGTVLIRHEVPQEHLRLEISFDRFDMIGM